MTVHSSPLRFAVAALAACLVPSVGLLAQQFAESLKNYLPLHRDGSYALLAVDVDKDGDRDLVIGDGGLVVGQQNKLYRNDGKGRFSDITKTHLPTVADITFAVAAGDVDGDGDVDLVFGNEGQNRLLLGDGTGKFVDAPPERMPLRRTYTSGVALVDVEKDGDLDLVLAGQTSPDRQTRLYLNNGAGTFTDVTAARMPTDGDNTWDLTTGDVDKDGDVDLVVGNQGQVRLYLNDGKGNFSDATATRLPVKFTRSLGVALGDLDRDGDLDIVLSVYRGQDRLYLNDGTGKFVDATAGRMPVIPKADKDTWDVTLADVDGDTDLDVVFAVYGQDRLFLNNGAGFFTDATQRLTQEPELTSDVVVADLDGDGDNDMVFANTFNQNRLSFNDGKGHFADATAARLPGDLGNTMEIAVGDVDKDGDPDLVVANSGDYVFGNLLYLNDGRGRFKEASKGRIPPLEEDTRSVALGDVDKDGDLDIVYGNMGAQNRLHFNNGAGVFADVTAARMPADVDPTSRVRLGDVDRDGDLDIIVANFGAQNRLYLNNGNGTFSDGTAAGMPAAVYETTDIGFADVDKDGDLDILIANGGFRTQRNRLLLGDGAGRFTDVTATHTPAELYFTGCLAMGDVDGDGDVDIVFGNTSYTYTGRENSLWRNDGTGHFKRSGGLVYDYFQTLSAALGDVDGDGDLDVVFGDHDHVNKLYLNDGKGQFVDATYTRMPAYLQGTLGVTLADVDADQDLDLVCANVGATGKQSFSWVNTMHLNRERHVWSPNLARLGDNLLVEIHARPGYAPNPQVAVPFMNLTPALPAIPLPPFGKLGVP